jgi:dihydrofolate synthase/folylpolyglutamate synthase
VAAFERIEAMRDGVPLTYFEYGTLAALEVFATAELDAVVLEVGMGGRLDAVNAVEPTASLITNVALDHCAWLGDDVETIAREKAGIMRSGKPAVFAGTKPPASILQHAKSIGAELLLAGRDYRWESDGARWNWIGTSHRLDSLRRPSLAGDIQLQNAAGALALLEAAGFESLLEPALVDRAFGDLRLRGRMETLQKSGNWLFDVAHNLAAAEVLASTLGELPEAESTVAMIGMLDDKDVEGVALALAPRVNTWIALTASGSRAIPAEELAHRIANATGRPCLAEHSLEEAIRYAREIAGDHGRILVTGSFYLVGPVHDALR